MSKAKLNDAQRDSHKVTLALHVSTATRLINEQNWSAAKTSLELALPHANAIGDKAIKGKVFGYLNTVRARAKKAASAEIQASA